MLQPVVDLILARGGLTGALLVGLLFYYAREKMRWEKATQDKDVAFAKALAERDAAIAQLHAARLADEQKTRVDMVATQTRVVEVLTETRIAVDEWRELMETAGRDPAPRRLPR